MNKTTTTTPVAPSALPAAPFIAGLSAGMHAVPRDYAARALSEGSTDSGALCGHRVVLALRVGAFDRATLPAWATVCPYCAWAVAAATGPEAIARELDALTPTGTALQALSRLLVDPLIARHLCEAIIAAAQQPGADGFDNDVIEVLAHAGAHTPVLLLSWHCDRDDCDEEPCACQGAAACPACSLRYGSWAGEQEGHYRPECTITAPCQVLATLAAHLNPPTPNPPVDQTHDQTHDQGEGEGERAATSGQAA